MIRIICIFLMLSILAGCATTLKYQESIAQWQGQNIQSLINAWGYADSAVKLGNGNTVYMYYHKQLFTTPTYPTAGPQFVSMAGPLIPSAYNNLAAGNQNQTMSLYCQTWFETNANGIITNTRFAGNNCVANSAHSRNP